MVVCLGADGVRSAVRRWLAGWGIVGRGCFVFLSGVGPPVVRGCFWGALSEEVPRVGGLVPADAGFCAYAEHVVSRRGPGVGLLMGNGRGFLC